MKMVRINIWFEVCQLRYENVSFDERIMFLARTRFM